MIQHTNAHQRVAGAALFRPPVQDTPEEYGKWSGRKYYSLEVIQHPIRARMCGFGDKDRRPLAPAAVAKLVVRRDDNSLVDVDDIDCSFFLVTVDLWSADANQEMNLVLHPSSADRYVPTNNPPPTKPRRRDKGSWASNTNTNAPASNHNADQQNLGSQRVGGDPSTPVIQTPTIPNMQGFPFPPPSIEAVSPFSPVVTAAHRPPTWGYPSAQSPSHPTGGVDRNTTYPPPILPSIHTFTIPQSTPTGNSNKGSPIERPASRNRTWATESPWGAPPSTANEYPYYLPLVSPQGIGTPTGTSSPLTVPTITIPSAIPLTPSSATSPAISATTTPKSNVIGPIPPLPRHTYTRTLVGPLSANATRLLDEHRKAGIFFLFQDLSVRTEGTFRLRLRLMNVGEPPAPEAGSVRIHEGECPVLAQCFTEPFTVFSAKRFPGVPDTTALSIALGNQGQKLPLRNRHGTSTKRNREDSESEAESD